MNADIFPGKQSNYLVTGLPGTGKTTVIIKLAEKLESSAVGFYTAEIKSGRRRRGFEIVSLCTGKRAVLAHVDFDSSRRVGKYGVRPGNLQPFLDELEEALEQETSRLLLIDEIGKMELFSRRFKEVVLAAFNSPHPLVATSMARPEPFCDALKKRSDVYVLELNRGNRDQIPAKLLCAVR